ncbi:MAG: hypothetical protein IPM54_39675 [Polyangiaceae bacterium]|nr:hypothetical protein [Polyangiaceae bacterium]
MSDNDVAEIDPPIGFDKWAPIAAEMLQRSSAERLEVLRRHSLTPEDWTPSDTHWSALLAHEIEAGDHARADIYAQHCAAEFKARREKSAPTEPVREVEQQQVAAEQAVAAVPTIEEKPPVVDAPPPLAHVPASIPDEAPPMHIEMPAAVPPPMLPKPKAPNALQGTSWSLDIPKGPSLPFAPSSASGDSAVSAAKSALQMPRPAPPSTGHSLGQTSDLPDLQKIARQIMPFKGDAAAENTSAPTSKASAPIAPAAPPIVAAPVTPAAPERVEVQPAHHASAPNEPEWTLEQYASLCAELELAPERTQETLHRYRVRPDQKAQLDAIWGARIRADRTLYAAFHHAKTTYAAWLMGTRHGS